MNLKTIRAYLVVYSLIAVLHPLHTYAQQNSDASTSQQPSPGRDGQHDFDFEIGRWKTHLARLQHPLTGSHAWVEYEGTTVVRKLWNGRANLVELEVTGPAGHIEGLSLRLYDPTARQWSLDFANSSGGILTPPIVGEFKNGRGEFYDQEKFGDRTILVRFVISDITANSCHFEQAFSDDGGHTWEVNWIATDTRITDTRVNDESAPPPTESSPASPAAAAPADQHDFDFELGNWDIHLQRLADRLANSHTWVKFDGTSVTRKVWDGRSQIEEFETDSPTGHIEGLTLRLYNPETHEWRLYWANSKVGVLDPPQIGQFKNGVGAFYAQDSWKGKMVIVRFLWTNTTTNKPHFEQSYSDDGGKTWEVNWITDQTRVPDESVQAH
jgi:hypothetical protein